MALTKSPASAQSVPMLRSPYFARAKRAQEKGDHNMQAQRSHKTLLFCPHSKTLSDVVRPSIRGESPRFKNRGRVRAAYNPKP